MKTLITLLMTLFTFGVFAQNHLFSETQYKGETQELAIGSDKVEVNFGWIKSVKLEKKGVLILYERYINGTPSGRHKMFTDDAPNTLVPFKPVYAISFENPTNAVMAFEQINFGGRSVALKKGKNIIPESFGVSSLYVPKGVNVTLYREDPDLNPDKQLEHRPMGAGIRPFVGGDMAGKVRVIYVK